MNRTLKLPVDFKIKTATEESVLANARILGLTQYHNGYSPVGDIRIGLSPFIPKNDVRIIRSDGIEAYVDELNAVGSSVWRFFVNDLTKIPEAWECNLYFSSFFRPISPKDPKTKFILCLTKGSGQVFKPVFKTVLDNFVPRENDMLVCYL